MKLAKKLIFSFIFIAGLVVLVGYLAIYFSESSLEQSITDDSVFLSKEILNDIEKNIFTRIVVSEELANDPRIITALKNSNKEFDKISDVEKHIEEIDAQWISGSSKENNFAENLLEHENSKILNEKINFYKEKYGEIVFAEIFTTNKYGANVAQSAVTSDYNQSDEEWWQVAKNEGMHINDVDFDESAEVYSIDISVRINDEDESFLGVLKSVISLNDILESIQTAKSESKHNSIQFELINNNYQLIYSTEQDWEIFEDVTSKPYFKSVIDGDEHFLKIENSFQEIGNLYTFSYSNGYRDFAGLDWSLVLKYDTQDVLQPVASLKFTILISSIVIGIIAISFGLLISRSIVIPIRGLTQSSERISKGEFGGVVKVLGNDEISNLSKSFNIMSRSLQKSISHGKNLEEIEKAKGEFMSMITHELRSPLTPIIGWCDALKNPTILGNLNEKQGKAVNTILSNALRLQGLISDLLDSQKLDLGKMSFDKLEFSVLDLMDRIKNNFEHSLKAKNIALDNLTKDKIILKSDEKRIEQVITNLINNAIDFVPPETGKIEINCKNEVTDVKFEVNDNGQGIEKEKQKQLFKKFYQADTSLRREHGGTGLGLSICKGIVEGLGGQIEVKSEIGKGTSFYFTIPKK
ncbi:MAG: sensor histidine kinase [Nitrosopumilus sp.]|nr:sensor histidine kinase [Nitrosopumilus sp.]